jgi:glutaredoxin
MLLEPLRWLVGRGVLGWELLTRKQPVQRSAGEQAIVDAATKGLAMYEFKACPFCMKVRKVIHHKNLKIELRDARRNKAWGEELRRQGGLYQTPCLKITSPAGSVKWMYESRDIIDYLDQRFPTA